MPIFPRLKDAVLGEWGRLQTEDTMTTVRCVGERSKMKILSDMLRPYRQTCFRYEYRQRREVEHVPEWDASICSVLPDDSCLKTRERHFNSFGVWRAAFEGQ